VSQDSTGALTVAYSPNGKVRAASERTGNNPKKFKDFDLKDKATIRSAPT
jgi:hypothetical protein